jgi:hypothetical protein
LTATGGSDSHGGVGHPPGYPRTYVRTQSAAGLAPALKAGLAFVSNGPLLGLRVQGKEPGETVTPESDGLVDVEISVLAPDWMQVEHVELWAGEQRVLWQAITRVPALGPLRFVLRARIAVGAARTLHAVARGGSGLEALLGRAGSEPLAFTNPVYIAGAEPQASAR